ncbi:MAG: hydroxyacid dehydrogenase [Lentisphaerae bacterium]|nr:hydroxyacid dehydrogenase [Lentisphaerota bacterium]
MSEEKKKTALFLNMAGMIDGVYGGGRRERLAEISDLYPEIINDENFDEHADAMADVEVIFSTWGIPRFDAERLDRLPALKAVFYGAGSMKGFAPLLLERGILVVGAWAYNAIPVAEYLLGTLLLANKGFFDREPRREEATGGWPEGFGNFERTAGLLGMGKIGRHLRELLRPVAVKVLVYDPYLDAEEVQALDVERVELEELFDRSVYVSNHIPALPETQDLIHGGLLRRLQEHATFVNIANGHSVAWKDLYGVFSERTDLKGIFDTIEGANGVMSGDEIEALKALPNILLSAHIAGALGRERRRMADGLFEEFLRWEAGQPPKHAVTAEMLNTMA